VNYKKNIFIAEMLNFFIWGFGYFYLNKQVIKGFVTFILYCLIWLFTLLFISTGSPLVFPIIFWMLFWNMWCSIFLSYDVYKIANEEKLPPLKIKKVKTVVRRSKVRTRRK
jgi:hypothetical protein